MNSSNKVTTIAKAKKSVCVCGGGGGERKGERGKCTYIT